jgi:hypothetical protein
LPIPIALLALAAYNLSFSGAFSLTAVGSSNLAAATATFWVQDPTFSTATNRAIRRMHSRIDDSEREALRESRDFVELQSIFAKHYAFHRFVHQFAFKEWLESHPAQSSLEREKALRAELGRVSMGAIKANPALYKKFVLSNLYVYFFVNSLRDRPLWDQVLPKRYERWENWVEERRASYVQFFGDYSHEAMLDTFAGEFNGGKLIRLRQSPSLDIARYVMERVGFAAAWRGWPIVYLVVGGLSLLQVVRTRARDPDCFFLFLLCASGFGAALVVCMVEPALVRYSYLTNFVIYLCLALSPLLLRRKKMVPASANLAGREPGAAPEYVPS